MQFRLLDRKFWKQLKADIAELFYHNICHGNIALK